MHTRRHPWKTLGLRALTTLMALTVLPAMTVLSAAGAASASTRQPVSNSKYGFRFSLPAGWNQVSLEKRTLGALLGPHHKVSATLGQSLRSEAKSDSAKGVVTLALSSSRDKGGSYPNVDVTPERGVVASTSQLITGVKEGLTQGGAQSVTAKAVHYPFGTAVVSTYAEVDTSSATGKIFGMQVYIQHASTVFIVTFTSAVMTVTTHAAAVVLPTWRFS